MKSEKKDGEHVGREAVINKIENERQDRCVKGPLCLRP